MGTASPSAAVMVACHSSVSCVTARGSPHESRGSRWTRSCSPTRPTTCPASSRALAAPSVAVASMRSEESSVTILAPLCAVKPAQTGVSGGAGISSGASGAHSAGTAAPSRWTYSICSVGE